MQNEKQKNQHEKRDTDAERFGVETSTLKTFLEDELARMTKRGSGQTRKDFKYLNLQRIVNKLNLGKTLGEVWKEADEVEKHALATRLENVEYHVRTELQDEDKAKLLREQVVDPLRSELYGTETDEAGESYLNFDRQVELEVQAQERNQ